MVVFSRSRISLIALIFLLLPGLAFAQVDDPKPDGNGGVLAKQLRDFLGEDDDNPDASPGGAGDEDDDEPLETLEVIILSAGTGYFRVSVSYDKPPPDSEKGLSLSIRSAASVTKLLLTPSEDGLTFDSGLLQLVAARLSGDPEFPVNQPGLPRLDAAFAGSAEAAAELFAGRWRVSHTEPDVGTVAGEGLIAPDGKSARLELDTAEGSKRYVSDDLLAVPDSAGGKHSLEIRFRPVDQERPAGPALPPAKVIYVSGNMSEIDIETPYQTYSRGIPVWRGAGPEFFRVNLGADNESNMHGAWSNEGTDGRLSGGGQQTWRKSPEINHVFVLDNQLELAYPFDTDGWDADEGRGKTRRLIVTGVNLRGLAKNSTSVGSDSTAIVYAVDPNGVTDDDPGLILVRAVLEGALAIAKAAKEPNQALIAKLETRREGLASADDLLVIDATLKRDVTPGFKHLFIERAKGSWPLLFGNQQAALQFVRHDDFVRTDSVPIFYPGDIGAVDLIFKTDIPFDSIDVLLLHRPVWAKEGEDAKEVGVVRARRMDDLSENPPPIFRTDPIHFISMVAPFRWPPENEDAFYINVLPGDKIGARLDDPARAKTQPPAVIAEIYGHPGALGELWKSALERVAKCDGDKFDGDPKYALKKSTRVEEVVIGEMAKYVSPIAFIAAELSGVDEPIEFFPSVTLFKGDHAAALLIRDEIVKMMAAQLPAFLPLAANRNGEATALLKWAVSSGQAGSLPVLSRFKTSVWHFIQARNPRILPAPLLTTWINKPLSVVLDDRERILSIADITPDEFDAWLDRQIHDAGRALYNGLENAVGVAKNASDCNLIELIVIAGQEPEPVGGPLVPRPVIERIVPRLVKRVSRPGTPPTEYWAPDKLARGYVERMLLGARAVAALDEYSKIDDAYWAMGVALATAGAAAGLSAAGFGATAAGLLIVGDVADAAYFGAKGLENALESEVVYEYAAGASLIIGEELFLQAEAQRESVGMALVGLIAPGIGAGLGLRDLRYFKNINKGKALLKTKGAGVMDDLDGLTTVERTQLAAFYSDLTTKIERSGLSKLDDTDRTALGILSDLENRYTTVGPPGAVEADQFVITPPRLSPEADPSGPYIGFPEMLGDDFQNALSDTSSVRLRVLSEDGKYVITPNNMDRIKFDEQPLGQGSFNTAFQIDDDFVARVPGGKFGKPKPNAIAADKGGREVFENSGADEGVVRLVHLDRRVKMDDGLDIPTPRSEKKMIRLDPGDEIEIVEYFEPGTLKSNMKNRSVKRMTAEEAIAYDKGVREMNRRGLVALDLKYDNFGFEPVTEGAKELRLVILDPGGIVPIKDGTSVTARQVQAMIDGTENGHGRYSHLYKKAIVLDEFGDAFDVRALNLKSANEIPFNPLGVADYARGRELSSMTAAEAEVYYQTLRAAD